jgi:undecaprenyl-diphosphatase
MTLFQALVLGLVQGFSEFLPISSSAHLALAPWFFRWSDPGLSFDVALHVGTALAVFWYFRREWAELTVSALRILGHGGARTDAERRVVFIVLATVPAVIAGVLLQDLAEARFRAPALIATALIVMGGALWLSDRWSKSSRFLDEMKWGDAVYIGLAQTLSLVPGVSRSGSTIATGRLLRFDRQSAARFSFLLSFPITVGAAVLKAPDAVRAATNVAPLVIGVVSAAVSGWIAIDVLLRFVVRRSYGVFALYRLLLGLVVFLVLVVRG